MSDARSQSAGIPMPPLNALRAFEAVARRVSFKLAAHELNVTPAALSHQVKSLEAFLERQLVVRGNRSISLTQDGRTLLAGLTDGFGRIEKSVAALRPRQTSNVLVVSSGPAFAAKWLAPRLADLMAALPDLDIRISAALTLSTFGEDGVDFAIRFGKGNHPGLFHQRLMGEELRPAASPDFLQRHPVAEAADMERLPLVHDDSLKPFVDEPEWTDWFGAQGFDTALAARGMRFNQADHAMDAALAGAGMILGRHALLDNDIRAGRLVYLPVPALPTDLAFYAVCPKGHETRPNEAAFLNWLVDRTSHYDQKAG
ncbi:MAG: LysR substrate-binding domain-containing protein [Pseudomonadota bacterium]